MSPGARDRVRLVLLPGMDGTGRLFDPLLRALPRSLVPTVVSYPAHTVTGLDELCVLVERALPIGEPFVLLAESFSGAVALKVAARRPAGLVAVVLVASFIRSPAGRKRPWTNALAALPFLGPMPTILIRRLLVGDDAPPSLVAAVARAVRSVSKAVFAARLRQILSNDVTEDAARCEVPMLYLEGKRDRLVSKRSEAELRAVRPDLITRTLDAPHALLQRRPDEAVAAIEAFLRGELESDPPEGPSAS